MGTHEKNSPESKRNRPEAAAPRPPRRWLRRLLILLGVMVVLLVAVYNYIASASFFHTWVQPKVAAALGRPVDVGSYSLSPSGWISLGKVSLGAKEGEKGPALELDSLECHFSPMALRQHILRIKSLHLTGLRVTMTQDENGVVSGPFPMGTPAPAPAPGKAPGLPKSASVPTLQLPLQLDLRDILIAQVSLRMEKAVHGQANPVVMALSDFSMKCPQLTLNGKSTVTLGALLESRPASNSQDPSREGFAARFASTIETDVAAGALRDVTAKTQLTDFTGTVQGEDLASYAAGLDTELKIEADGRSAQLLPTVFYVRQKDKELAKAELNATVDLSKMSGEVNFNLQPVDHRVLNLVSASQGIDCRDTKVSGSFKLVVGDQATLRSLEVEFGVQDLNPTGGPLPEGGFPSTNIDAVARASASKDGKVLTLDALRAHVIQGTAEPLLAVEMAKPIPLDPQTLQPAQGALGPEAVKVIVHDLKLADWAALLARNAGVKVDSGTVSADLKVGEGPGVPGDSAALAGTVTMAGLHGTRGDAAFGPLTANVQLDATLGLAAKHLSLAECLATLTSGGTLRATGEMTYSPAVSGKIDLEAQDFRLTPWMPLLASVSSKVDLSQAALSGKQALVFALGDKGKTASVTGTLRLAGLAPAAATPEGGKSVRTDVGIENDVALADVMADVRKCAVQITHDGGKADLVNLTGKINTAKPEEGSLAISSASLDLLPLLTFGGVHPAADAPPLKIEDLKATLAMLPGGGLNAKDLTLKIANGTVACSAFSMENKAGAADPVLTWRDCKGAGLDVDTLLASLAPANRGKLTGTAEFDASGQAQGFSQEAMTSALRTTVSSKIENGKLVGLPLTEEIANATHISQLKDMDFTRLDCGVQTDGKGIQLTEVDLVGPEQKIVVKGTVGYDMKLAMPLSLAIGGDLKSRIQGQPYAAAMKEDAEGYLAFPAAMTVSGTASKPSVKLNLDKAMLIDVGLGILNQTMKDRANGKGGKSGGLGGLLPGGTNPLGPGGKPGKATPATDGALGAPATPKPAKTPKNAAPGTSPTPKPAKTPKASVTGTPKDAAPQASPKAATPAAETAAPTTGTLPTAPARPRGTASGKRS
jgi:hypothetical protein